MRVYGEPTDQVTPHNAELYETKAAVFWDRFYRNNERSFFKDRHYLEREFPCLQAPDAHVLEVGCGVGNTSLPVAALNPSATIYSCDYAATAVQLLRDNAAFDAARMHAFVADITHDDLTLHVPPASIDVVTCIFVFSANAPDHLPQAVQNLKRVVKRGTGVVVVRDYAVGDLAEQRLAAKGKQQKLGANFYVRGDGTRCLYFTQDSLCALFEGAGFECKDVRTHVRTIENRKRGLAMERRWVQAVFALPEEAEEANEAEGAGDAGCRSPMRLAGAAGRVAAWAPGATWRSQLPETLDDADTVAAQLLQRPARCAAEEEATLEAAFAAAVARDVRSVVDECAHAAARRGEAACEVVTLGRVHLTLPAGSRPRLSELALAHWLADNPALVRSRYFLDFGSGLSCACAVGAVQHCWRYTYTAPTQAVRDALRQQLHLHGQHIVCERVHFVLADSVLPQPEEPNHAALNQRMERQVYAQTGYNAIVIRVSAEVGIPQALLLARSQLRSSGLVIFISEDAHLTVESSDGLSVLCSRPYFSVCEYSL